MFVSASYANIAMTLDEVIEAYCGWYYKAVSRRDSDSDEPIVAGVVAVSVVVTRGDPCQHGIIVAMCGCMI